MTCNSNKNQQKCYCANTAMKRKASKAENESDDSDDSQSLGNLPIKYQLLAQAVVGIIEKFGKFFSDLINGTLKTLVENIQEIKANQAKLLRDSEIRDYLLAQNMKLTQELEELKRK